MESPVGYHSPVRRLSQSFSESNKEESRSSSQERTPEGVSPLAMSPPRSPIVNLSPKVSRRNRNLSKHAIRRTASLTDVNVLVTDRWDLSPKVRRNSMIFRKEDLPQVPTSDVAQDVKVLQQVSKKLEEVISLFTDLKLMPIFQIAKEESIQAPEPSISQSVAATLEDIAREGILEAAYAGIEYGWSLLDVQDNIWVYRKSDGESVDAFKACCFVSVPPKDFIAVLRDTKSMQEWDEWIDTAREVESVDDHCKVVYYSYLGSPKVGKRDYCVLTAWGICENGTEVFSIISIEHKEVPLYEGRIRGEIFMRGYVAKPVMGNPNQAVVVHVAQYDMKGDGDISEEKKSFIAMQNGLTIRAIEKVALQRLRQNANA